MTFGQVVVTVLVVGFFVYELVAFIREWKKRIVAKTEIEQKDGNENGKRKTA